MNKLIIFDWGGVIESHREGEYNVFNARLDLIKHYRNDLSYDEIEKGYQNISTNEYVKNIGKYNDITLVENWFNVISKEFSLKCSFDDFKQIYLQVFDKIYYYKDVVEYAHSLNDKCKTAILSNLTLFDKERINKQVNLDKFDYVWLSFELETRKPEETIYKIVEQDCQIQPENILFIDDTKENLIIPKKRGWNTCQAYGYELEIIKKAIDDFIKE